MAAKVEVLVRLRRAARKHCHRGPGDLGATMAVANAVGAARKLGVTETTIRHEIRTCGGKLRRKKGRR